MKGRWHLKIINTRFWILKLWFESSDRKTRSLARRLVWGDVSHIAPPGLFKPLSTSHTLPWPSVALTCGAITTHIGAFHRAASERCFRGKRPPAVTFFFFFFYLIFEAQFGLKSINSQLWNTKKPPKTTKKWGQQSTQETKEAPITAREERVQPQRRLCATEKVNKIMGFFFLEKNTGTHIVRYVLSHILIQLHLHTLFFSACVTALPLNRREGLQLMVRNYCIASHYICCTSDFAAQTWV